MARPQRNGETSRASKILEAATTLFSEKGYAAVGVDEIGVQAGVTGPAVYRYFHGKEEILAALFDEAIDGTLRATSGRFDDPLEELDYRVHAHAEYVTEDQKLASIWIREGRSLSEAHRRRLHRREVHYLETWTDCVRRCFPHLPEHQARRATVMALGTLNSVALWPAGSVAGPGTATDLADFVLGGLKSSSEVARLVGKS